MKSGYVPPAAAICVRRRHESRHFQMPFFLRSVSYPRFVLFRYAAIPPSAAPVRFPLEITQSLSRKGIAEDSAPFSPGRSFTFQRAIVKPYKPMTEKSSICRLTAARKSCTMRLEYRHIYRSPSGSLSFGFGGRSVAALPPPPEGRKTTNAARPSQGGALFVVPPL